ncbi:MAG TPA: hypothetical protein VD970_09610, partial [Acetobacteraceae bacterium]|nr:hypothetical protein [Acetobacteraceae bacterium]
MSTTDSSKMAKTTGPCGAVIPFGRRDPRFAPPSPSSEPEMTPEEVDAFMAEGDRIKHEELDPQP